MRRATNYPEVYPCFHHKALSDLLEASGITWRHYGVGGDIIRAPGPLGIWTAPNSIAHICKSTGPGGACRGSEWSNHMVFTPSQVLTDISDPACNLAGVSWVIPEALSSDHMGNPKNTGGPSWVASIVDKVGPEHMHRHH